MDKFILEYGVIGFLAAVGLFFLVQFMNRQKENSEKLDQIRHAQIAMQENVRSTLDQVSHLSITVRDHEIRLTKLEVKQDMNDENHV